MDKRLKRQDYNFQETGFFLKTIAILPILIDRDYEYSRDSSSKQQPAYGRSGRKITYTISKKTEFWLWYDLNQKKGGTLTKFLMMEFNCDQNAAFDLMREIADRYYRVEYAMFKEQHKKLQLSGETGPSTNYKVSNVPVIQTQEFQFDKYKEEIANEKVTEFAFEKATSFGFFHYRGLKQETIDAFPFKDRFGNATGPFGYYPRQPYSPRPGTVSKFVFPDHMIIPIQDFQGRVVGLEAKNLRTDAGYQEEIKKLCDKGENPAGVRIHPSAYYPNSSKRMGAWISNIPENPKAICLSEQPIDAMSYYQMHPDDPLVHQTIFISTGGGITSGLYAIIFDLIQKYNIETIISAFDKDLPGLIYSLEVMKSLPFNMVDEQKCFVNFHANEKQEIEIDVLLRSDVSKQTSETLMLSVERLRNDLTKNYSFEGGFEIYPALTKREAYVTIALPYSEKNISEIIRISQYLLKTRPGVFQTKFPPNSKDWNDELRNILRKTDMPSILLLDRPEDRNKLFISKKNELIFHQRFASFDHNIQESVGEVNPFAKKNFINPAKTIIPYEFVMHALHEAQNDYSSSIPVLKDVFVNQALRQGIAYVPMTKEFVLAGQPLATWSEEQTIVYGKQQPDALQIKALHWMGEQLRVGKDPNKTELSINYNTVRYQDEIIGTLSKWFTFQEKDGFHPDKMSAGGVGQLELFMEGLSEARRKWDIFREKYTEPLTYYSSSNLVMEENRIPLYEYDTINGRLVLLAEPETMLARNFHPYFFKALQLFVENQGVFYNYLRLMKVEPSSGVVFYNSRHHEVGRLVEDGDGKKYVALFQNIPVSMRAEMEMFSPYPIASAKMIMKLGIELEPSGLSSKIKEKKISKIPYSYQLFFNKDKFSPWNEEKLKRASRSTQQLHTEAYLWHINNIGTPQGSIGNEKDQFYERQGVVYFNRIPVAKYNAVADVLDMLAPPSKEFFQFLAIFERNLVKNPAHRVYGDHLLLSDTEKITTAPASLEQILKILDKIDQDVETGRLLIVDKNFKVRDIGYMDAYKIVIDEVYKRYSETFRDALAYLAEESSLQLEWRNLEFENASVKANLSSIEIVEQTARFEHELITTPSGLLQSVVQAPVFQKELSLAEGEFEYLFLPGLDGQKTMPYGSAWHKVKDLLFWRTLPFENATTLVLAQNPDQAMLYYHYKLPESLHENVIYLSVLGTGKIQTELLVQRMLETRQIKQLMVVGDDDFIKTYQGEFSSHASFGVFAVPVLTVDQAMSRIKKELFGHEPDVQLQNVIEGISGHNFLNPAKGIVYFPMRSEAMTSKAVLGSQLMLSKDVDALWYSRPLRNSQRVVLTSSPEEALYYMALNKEFIHNDAIIAFQNTVTDQQVKSLTDQLKVRRFHGNVIVANSGHLGEQLMDPKRNFRLPIQLHNPLFKTTFQMDYESMTPDYQMVKRDMEAQRRSFEVRKLLGKSEAPAWNETIHLQGPKEQYKLS